VFICVREMRGHGSCAGRGRASRGRMARVALTQIGAQLSPEP
jgi:hypothetical protein